jgi:gamma-glutamyltranspeptidase/glutathione hydrolase
MGARTLRRTFILTLIVVCSVALVAGVSAETAMKRHIIVASHPLASDAGEQMLKQGGSAVDAAIAAQMVMGLVEPQSSGLGGGAFLMHWDPKSRSLESYDGRETAPLTTRPDLFLKADGTPQDFVEAVVGGKSVGVPGLMAMLELAYRDHGHLPWPKLFQPAIRLAEEGFPVSERLAKAIAGDPMLARIPGTAAYFLPNGHTLKVGDIVQNRDYGATLRMLAAQGPHIFYDGEIAKAIVHAVRNSPIQPGDLTLGDMGGYKAIKRKPVCGTYRDAHICSMGPPSSGAIATLQILGMLERFNLAPLDPNGAKAAHLFAEANRLAFADRSVYAADPAAMNVPLTQLLSRSYVRERALLIDPSHAKKGVQPGQPGVALPARALMNDFSRPSTAHVSIIDGQGHAVAFTTTIEGGFGSHLMARGFILNNQLTDFTFEPEREGRTIANAPGPNKRPMSSMSPAFIFDRHGELTAILGSPGGWRIIPYVARTAAAIIDWDLSATDAVALPHIAARNDMTELESGQGLEATAAALSQMGHIVKFSEMQSGLNIVRITTEGYVGAADPRREGTVKGE